MYIKLKYKIQKLKFKIFLLFTIHCSLLTVHCSAQEQFGIASSVYAGINGIWLNPSSSACSPFRFDFNIITFHTYFDNNDFYVYKANIPKLIANGSKPINAYNQFDLNHGISSNIMFYDEKTKGNVNLFQNFLLQGPSLMLSYEKWSIALITDIRSGASALNLSNEVAQLGFENMTYKPLSHKYIYVPDFRINGTGWAEIGLNLSGILMKNREMLVKGGLTFKYLLGISDIYLHNKSTYLYYANDKDMNFYYLNEDYGHSIPGTGSGVMAGTGQSLDLGISFQRFERTKSKTHKSYFYNNSDCPVFCKTNPYLLYKWKLGISLIDMGYINFNRNSQTFIYNDVSTDWLNFAHWAPKKIEGFDNGLSSNFINQAIAQPVNNHFTTILPMALSAQYDYYFMYEYYMNFTIIQRLPHFNTPGIDRLNTFSITPRWDDSEFGVSVPLILYEYRYPRIGLSFRFFNIFVVGTDKLGAFFNNKVTGMDLYFSIKVNKFNPCK